MKFSWKEEDFLGLQTTGKISTCSNAKDIIDSPYPPSPISLPVNIPDRIISFPSTGKILEGALPPL